MNGYILSARAFQLLAEVIVILLVSAGVWNLLCFALNAVDRRFGSKPVEQEERPEVAPVTHPHFTRHRRTLP